MRAVIPAAGLGTRFLPYTKAQPKEMLPLLDKPAIQFVVEEAFASGMKDILIVTGRTKRAIEDHFDANPELERHLRLKGMADLLGELSVGLAGARIAYLRQAGPLGNGHAVLLAESSVGRESFAVLFADDIFPDPPGCIASLAKWHEKTGASCIAVQRIPRSEVPSYGMVLGKEVRDGLFRVSDIIEKPERKRVSSNLVTVGRYVFTPSIFDHLHRVRPGRGGELWLTDAIRSLLNTEHVYAWVFRGRRFDIGSKDGWLLANLELAWRRPEYRASIRRFLKTRSPRSGARR